jgi:predicted component of type VI protein secretion system
MRFRLRYQQHDLELAEGQFAVGRNASCQLALDDPLVSRRHALFTIEEDAVIVEDLASRNGVLVNGVRIEGPTELMVGDRVIIGSQEITLLVTADTEDRIPVAQALRMTQPKIPVDVVREAIDHPLARAARAGGARDSRSDARYEYAPTEHGGGAARAVAEEALASSAPSDELETSMIRRTEQFRVLGSVADKALALGRSAEAERLLASALADVIEACRMGRPMPWELVDEAARFSARLATATGKGGWADYVIELYQGQDRPPPAAVIAELYTALRKITNLDVERLRDLLEQLKPASANYGPADRFLYQRLEGFLRLATTLR